MFHQKKKKAEQSRLLEELYRLYEQRMYRVAYGILRHPQQAEDAVQDTFLKLVRYLPSISRADSEETRLLVLRILKTTAIDQYRRNRRDSERLTEEEALDSAGPAREKALFFPMRAAENRAYLKALLDGLPQIYLDVIRLRCYFGFSGQETADILGISPDAVSKRLERARKLISERIGDEPYEEKYGTDYGKSRRASCGRGISE